MSLTDEYMSVHDAAIMLNIDRTRINRLLNQGRFDGAVKIARNWVIPRASVENFKRLPPGVKSRTKQQHEEDKAMLARLRESTRQHGNADGEICGDNEGG